MGTRQNSHNGCCIILVYKHVCCRMEYVEYIFHWFRTDGAHLCRYHGGESFCVSLVMSKEIEICYAGSRDLER